MRIDFEGSISVGTRLKKKVVPVALLVDDARGGPDAVEGPAQMALHVRLDDVQRVEDGADERPHLPDNIFDENNIFFTERNITMAYQGAAGKVGEEFAGPVVGGRGQAAELVAQREEECVAEAVARQDRRQAAPVLAHAEGAQLAEGVPRVAEALVVVSVLRGNNTSLWVVY